MKFEGPLYAVSNMEASKRFYAEVLGQTVVMDFGKNVSLSGGISLQEEFPEMLGLDPSVSVKRACNGEMYFEEENITAFAQRLTARGDIELVHGLAEAPWGQRTIRFYDPDGHIIEVGEPMPLVVIRHLFAGMSPEEVHQKTMMPLEIVSSIWQSIQK